MELQLDHRSIDSTPDWLEPVRRSAIESIAFCYLFILLLGYFLVGSRRFLSADCSDPRKSSEQLPAFSDGHRRNARKRMTSDALEHCNIIIFVVRLLFLGAKIESPLLVFS